MIVITQMLLDSVIKGLEDDHFIKGLHFLTPLEMNIMV